MNYWDSSTIFVALSDLRLCRKLDREGGVTRPHSLAEVFSALTGKQGPYRVRAEDASRQLSEISKNLSFAKLTAEDVLTAMKDSEKRGVRGGRIHDFLDAIAAKKAGAEQLFTADRNDFEGLVNGLKIKTI